MFQSFCVAFCAMDSPFNPNHLPEVNGGCFCVLPEDLIISSQPSEFLLDIAREAAENKANLSVVVDENLSDEVTNFIHA
jgi:hypothetical protein